MDGNGKAENIAVPSFSLDSGLFFERDASFLGRSLTQTLEPRAFFVRTPYRDQRLLPNYDSAAFDFNLATIYTENPFGGNDRIAAGLGDDVIWGDHDDGTADYGSDTIEGNAGNDVLIGGGNNDVLIGQGGRDTLIGGGGDDRMFGGPGVDKIFGGPGNDASENSDQDLFNSVEVTL